MKKPSNQVNPPKEKPKGKYPFKEDDKWRLILKDKAGASMVMCKDLPYVSCKILSGNIKDFLIKHKTKLNGELCIIR